MNPDEPQLDRPDPLDAALDSLLAKARWPVPSPVYAARLEAVLRSTRRRSHWRRVIGAGITALAASIVLLVSVRSRPPLEGLRHAPSKGVEPLLMMMGADSESSTPQNVSRPATPYERLIVASPQPVPSARETQPTAPNRLLTMTSIPTTPSGKNQRLEIRTRDASEAVRRSAMQALLERGAASDVQAYLSCVLDPALRGDALAAIDAMPEPPVDLLLANLNCPLVDHRYAAARVLGQLHDESLPSRLAQMIATDTNRREALAVLVWSTGPAAARTLKEATFRSPALQSEVNALQQEMDHLH